MIWSCCISILYWESNYTPPYITELYFSILDIVLLTQETADCIERNHSSQHASISVYVITWCCYKYRSTHTCKNLLENVDAMPIELCVVDRCLMQDFKLLVSSVSVLALISYSVAVFSTIKGFVYIDNSWGGWQRALLKGTQGLGQQVDENQMAFRERNKSLSEVKGCFGIAILERK